MYLDPNPKKQFNPFGFTDHEALWDTVSDARVTELLSDPATTLHSVTEDENNYGNFLFITCSRTENGRPMYVTFSGLGYHQPRGRWITDNWTFYTTNSRYGERLGTITLAEVEQAIATRRADVEGVREDTEQTEQQVWFELLADMSDDDYALSIYGDTDI